MPRRRTPDYTGLQGVYRLGIIPWRDPGTTIISTIDRREGGARESACSPARLSLSLIDGKKGPYNRSGCNGCQSHGPKAISLVDKEGEKDSPA